jgi:hypothetical protein
MKIYYILFLFIILFFGCNKESNNWYAEITSDNEFYAVTLINSKFYDFRGSKFLRIYLGVDDIYCVTAQKQSIEGNLTINVVNYTSGIVTPSINFSKSTIDSFGVITVCNR